MSCYLSRTQIAILVATWVLSMPAASAEKQAVYYFGPTVAEADASGGRYPLGNVTIRDAEEIRMVAERGTLSVRVTPTDEFDEFSALMEIYPSRPRLHLKPSFKFPRDETTGEIIDKSALACVFTVGLSKLPDGNAYETVSNAKDPVLIRPGEEVSLIWTWSGVDHRLYIDGKRVARRVAYSPFPYHFQPDLRLNAGSRKTLKVHEYVVYNYAMDEQDIEREAGRDVGEPLEASAVDPPHLVAQWAPGEKRFYGMIDAGATRAGQAKKARFTAIGPDDKALGQASVDLRNGFGEAAGPLSQVTPGTYRVRAEVLNAGGQVIARSVSGAWTLPQTEWVGNTIGLTAEIQPPWTPITRQGETLGVWGREIQLGGGFGLPQQIVSQAKPQLATPITLNLVRNGKRLLIADTEVNVTSAKPHKATWVGSGIAEGVKVSIAGSLEYDGMVLLDLTLEPVEAHAHVEFDEITLDMVMPTSEAIFLNACTDQGYWWYPKRQSVGAKPGWKMTNLDSKSGRTNFWFFMLLCNRTTGLEWFADNLQDWAVDENRPVQELVRQDDGSVRFTCKLANQSFTLTGKRTMQFGYMATPVKPLPNDWRSLYCHHHPLDLNSDLGVWWLWSGGWDKYRPNIFSLLPQNPEMYANSIGPDNPILMAPFTNQHVLTPSGKDATDPNRGWPYFHNITQAETENDGWDSTPTCIMQDYWAFNTNQWLQRGGMEAIYIDEANTQTVGRGLLSGVGYLRDDGTRATGHNTLGMRKQLKRIRQVQIDNGKRPLVWIPVYSKMIPHAFSFVDIVSEGEAFMFEEPEGPNWMDVWGEGILDEPGTRQEPATGEWLLSIGDAQKFGFMPLFLNYIKFFDHETEYYHATRSQLALLALFDIIPIDPSHAWFFKVKENFGMNANETSFHRFDTQQEIYSGHPEVPVSYYRRGNSILVIVVNMSDEAFVDSVTVDKGRLEIEKDLQATLWKDAAKKRNSIELTRESVVYDEESLRVSIPPKDVRVVELK